jgi:SPP1 family predicted phage head-tail adaptor
MQIGRIRNRVTLQQLTTANDGQGGRAKTFATLAQVWARLEPWKGNENVSAGQQHSELLTKVTIRYRDDVKPKQRIVFGSRTLEIVTVLFGNTPDEVEMLCAEVLS